MVPPLSLQVPSSPPPLAAPIARRLSVSASVAGEEGLMSCVLPEELIVEILSERLQVSYNDQKSLHCIWYLVCVRALSGIWCV